MKNYEAIVGFTGSELERASLMTGIMPRESRFEALVRREIAKGLTKLAGKIDPYVFAPCTATR